MKRKHLKQTAPARFAGTAILALTILTGCGAEETVTQSAQEETDLTADQKEHTELQNDETKAESADSAASSPSPREAELQTAVIRHHYADVLSQLCFEWQLPDIEIEDPNSGGWDWYQMSDNTYAVTDIDGDGREELIINFSTSGMAGMFTVVYEYHPDTDELAQELLEFPALTYYNNGAVKAEASHNHTTGEFWPFTLYQYDSASDSYCAAAYISTWDKSISDSLYDYERDSQKAFPDELDTDGDGILYAIQTDLSGSDLWGVDAYQLNQADYQMWYDEHLGGANEIAVDAQPIESDRFCVYTEDYLALLAAIKKETVPTDDTDIGLLLLAEHYSVDEIGQKLADDYGVTFENTDPDGIGQTGSLDGKEIFEISGEDGGWINYKNDRIEGIVTFGIYPGMKESEARRTIAAYGFVPAENYYDYDISSPGYQTFVTGLGLGNRRLSYQVENGIVKAIDSSSYCAYVG